MNEIYYVIAFEAMALYKCIIIIIINVIQMIKLKNYSYLFILTC